MGKFAFRDNRNILNAMLSKPDGLLAVVDEQSRAPDSTDASILSLFHFNKLMSELAFIKIFQQLQVTLNELFHLPAFKLKMMAVSSFIILGEMCAIAWKITLIVIAISFLLI